MTWRDWLVIQVASWWYGLPSEVVFLLLMSCNLCCPVRLSTSMIDTWSFHVMPRIFRKLCWWKTSSCWHILAVLFQVSLAYMAVETTKEGIEVQFNLKVKCAGSPHVVKSFEDCCCFCQSSVDICFNISIARYYTSQVGESLYIFYVPLCNNN